jgi:hypothetical protein
MMTPTRFLKLTLTLSLLAAPAFADSIGQREQRQQARVAQGERSGELNRREAGRLERQERRVSREVNRDRREGRGLSRFERAGITARQNHLSREIYRAKHDRR